MKRHKLAAVLVLVSVAAMILCATAAARAGKPTSPSIVYTLTPPPGSDFPNASGSVTLAYSAHLSNKYKWDTYYMSLQAQGLAPNRPYLLRDYGRGWNYYGTFYSDANGDINVSDFFVWGARNPLGLWFEICDDTYTVELSSYQYW